MSFEDELKQLISDATAAQERRNQELSAFDAAWQTTKLDVVKPALERAVKALEGYPQFGAEVEMRNGSILLKIKPKTNTKARLISDLKFSPNKETLEIECMYAVPDIVLESFTLDSLDQRTVETKIKQFLSAALG